MRKSRVTATVVTTALLAAGCGAGGSESAGGSDPIKIGWVKVPMDTPKYLMDKAEDEYGLEIELVEFKRYPDLRVAVGNGSVDYGTVSPVDIALAADSDEKSLIALAGQAKGGDLIAKSSKLGTLTWDEVIEKPLTLGSFGGGIAWIKTAATIEEAGHKFGDVKTLKVAGSIFDMMQTLKSGQTDLVMNVDPAIAQGVEDGYAEYADALDINSSSVGSQNTLFVTNSKMLSDENLETTEKVLDAYLDQLSQLQEDESLWADSYQEYTGQSDAVAKRTLERIELSYEFSDEELSSLAEFLVKKGLASKSGLPEQAAELYNYDLLSEATGSSPEELGKSAEGGD